MKSYIEQLRALETEDVTEEIAFYRLLGLSIKKAREQKKLLQKDLASLIGVSQSCLARIEIGESRAQVYDLVRIARVLNIKLSELIPKC